MHIVNSRQFGEIKAFEFGYGPVGRPYMSVYVYLLDGVIIDTGQSHMRKHVIEQLQSAKPYVILLTHHHEDHSGNAFALGDCHRVDVFGHPLTAQKMALKRKILPYKHKKHNIEIALFVFIICGAEGETRTRTGVRPLDPEPSASTSSATSARLKRLI